ncbi:hypothetical protein RQP46_002047 [Phenoliferia psychrophenolica]
MCAVKDHLGVYVGCGRGHVCCRACFAKLPTAKNRSNSTRSCPKCEEQIWTKTPIPISAGAQRRAWNVQVRCTAKNAGVRCTWEGPFGERDAHMCDITCVNCGVHGRADKLSSAAHWKVCPGQYVRCPRSHFGCEAIIKRFQIGQHETEECQVIPCRYNNNAYSTCQYFGNWKELDKHEHNCSRFHHGGAAQGNSPHNFVYYSNWY